MTKGIYQLTIPGNDKVYIGRSLDIEKRFQQHLRLLQKKKHHNPAMNRAFKEGLEMAILLEGNNSALCEQRELNKVPRNKQFNYYKGVDDGWTKRKKGKKRAKV